MPVLLTNDPSFLEEEYVSSAPPPAMPPPPIDDEEYDTAEDLVHGLNLYTKKYGYAVIIRGSAKSPRGVRNKIYIRCTRGGKPDPHAHATKRTHAGSRLINCRFLAAARLADNDKWRLTEILRSEHNHEGGNEGSHSNLRRYFMEDENVMTIIRDQHLANSTPQQILNYIRIKFNMNVEDPIIGIQDVYNALTRIRQEELGNMTPIQALHVQLHDPELGWGIRVDIHPDTPRS